MPLFTMVAIYEDGLYVSQHRATSPHKAVFKWIDQESVANMKLTKKQKDNLKLEFDDMPPSPLAGTVSAWCNSGILKKKLLLLNIVKTKES